MDVRSMMTDTSASSKSDNLPRQSLVNEEVKKYLPFSTTWLTSPD